MNSDQKLLELCVKVADQALREIGVETFKKSSWFASNQAAQVREARRPIAA